MKRTLISLIFLALRSKGRNEDGERFVDKNRTTIRENTPINKFAVVINKVDLVNPKEKLLFVANDVGSMAESCIRRLLEQRRNPSKIGLGDLVDDVYANYTEEAGFDKVHEDDLEVLQRLHQNFYLLQQSRTTMKVWMMCWVCCLNVRHRLKNGLLIQTVRQECPPLSR